MSFLAWIALVPLFLALLSTSPKFGFLLSLLCGVVFFAGVFSWGLEVYSYTYLHHFLLSLCFGSYLAFIGLAIGLISRRSGATIALFAAPFVWVSMEYLKSTYTFLAFPWGLLAHTQHQNPTIIQIASVTGAYGVSFLVVVVNSACTAMLLPRVCTLTKAKSTFDNPVSRRGVITIVCIAAILTSLSLLYGQTSLSKPIIGKGIKVAVVQGNIEQAKKWNRRFAKFIMKTYADLTLEASYEKPELIIWPETATPGSISKDSTIYRHVRRIGSAAGTYLLLGSSEYQKFKGSASSKVKKVFNSAFLIPPDEKAKHERYSKLRLLPFGEYLPLKDTIPWPYINVPLVSESVPGGEFTVFEHPSFRFGVTICWENIFPDLVRQFVKRGAQLIVNITNEAWFGKTAAPYQFVSMSVFRAVENRVFVVRCANTGVSCFIDPYGRIADRVKDENGQDLFIRGVLTREVIPMESKTIYTRYGDLLAWLSLLCSAGFLLIALLRRNTDSHSK